MKNRIILGAGLIAVDHIFLSEGKKSDPKDPKFIGSTGGGSVSNTLAMLSLLGHKCYVFGVLGNDLARYIAEKEFKEYSIDYNYVVSRGDVKEIVSTRQYSHIIYANKSHEYRESCAECGTNFGKRYQISKEDVGRDLIYLSSKIELFIVDRANSATVFLARNVKNRGGFVAYDMNFVSFGRYAENVGELLKNCDLVKTDKKTLRQLLRFSGINDVSQWKHEYPRLKYLLITDSENGVDCYFNISGVEYFVHRDAIVNENIKDTGGAGDVFLAVLIHELTDENDLGDILDIQKKIDKAQALASLSCSMYGSRALQRFFLNNKMSPQEIMNTAEDIYIKGSVSIPLDSTIGLPKFPFKPYVLTDKDICRVCGLPREHKGQKKLTHKDETITYERMFKTLSAVPNAMFSGFEMAIPFRKKLSKLLEKNTIFVGSGGSFSASSFGEYLFMKGKGIMAKAITPYELEGWNIIPENTSIWLISQGGFNTDILGVALHLQDIKARNVIVLTGSQTSFLADLARENKWERVLISSTERNFVSTIGLLTQVAALSALLSSDKQLDELREYFNYDNLNEKIRRYFSESQALIAPLADMFGNGKNPHIIAVARGWGWPSLVDLESKVIEGGISTIEISELKNYTHGRWMNLYGRDNRVLIIYETPEDQELVNFFKRKFTRFSPIVVTTEKEGISGSVDLMLKTLFVANFLGKLAKKNILKPKFPKQGRGLYSWEPDSRQGKWERNKNKLKPTHYNKELS